MKNLLYLEKNVAHCSQAEHIQACLLIDHTHCIVTETKHSDSLLLFAMIAYILWNNTASLSLSYSLSVCRRQYIAVDVQEGWHSYK